MSSSETEQNRPVAGLRQRTNNLDTVSSKANKTAEIAKDEVRNVAVMAQEAVFSGAWMWPIQGLLHLVTHPNLIRPLLPAIFSSTLFTLTITLLLFVTTYLPHVAILAFVSGPLAFIAAIPLILGEGAAIGLLVSRVFWLGKAMEDLFDEVLLKQGNTELVSRGREIKSGGGGGKKLGKVLTKPFSKLSKENLVRWLVSLPLNAIPVVGPFLFFLYNGAKPGPSYHSRYFQLKSIPPHTFDRDDFVHAHRGSYTAFGAMAMALDVVIPGGAVLCLLGNVVGAALWASEIEKQEGKRS